MIYPGYEWHQLISCLFNGFADARIELRVNGIGNDKYPPMVVVTWKGYRWEGTSLSNDDTPRRIQIWLETMRELEYRK